MKRLIFPALVLAVVLLWLVGGKLIGAGFDPAKILAHLRALATDNLALAVLGFVAVYVAVTGLSLPLAVPLSLIAGAVFGVLGGTVLVSVSATAGAACAFLLSRWLLRARLTKRFGPRLAAVERGLDRDGAFYLFTLRLLPVFPFALTNLLMGLTRMRLFTFWWVSQLGMLPGTLAYVNAGAQLGDLGAARHILLPGLIASFAALGLLPWVARLVLARWRNRRLYARWTRPAKFDRNLIVIGAGSAGLVATYMARTLQGEVSVIEQQVMGGDCLNFGCVPSKALIHLGKIAHSAKAGQALGMMVSGAPDLPAIMARVNGAVAGVAPHDSVARYQGLGAEVLLGTARLIDPWTVEVTTAEGTLRRTARAIVLASGAAPALPDLPGLAGQAVTSETLWAHLSTLPAMPRRIAIIGGGPIGCELAQALQRLGAQVTLLQRGPRLLPREELEVSTLIHDTLQGEGVDIRLNCAPTHAEPGALFAHDSRIDADLIIAATGRQARLSGYGLEGLGIEVAKTVLVNEFLQTSLPNIFAAGDIASSEQFTHTAGHMGVSAALNGLALGLWRFRYDGRVMPRVTFTDPEVASIGISTQDSQGQAFEVTDYDLADLDRAIAEEVRHGLLRVLTEPGKDRILGVTIVAPRAGEMIAEFALAMQAGLGLGKILRTVHAYPTWADANKLLAGAQARKSTSPRALALLAKVMAWRRG